MRGSWAIHPLQWMIAIHRPVECMTCCVSKNDEKTATNAVEPDMNTVAAITLWDWLSPILRDVHGDYRDMRRNNATEKNFSLYTCHHPASLNTCCLNVTFMGLFSCSWHFPIHFENSDRHWKHSTSHRPLSNHFAVTPSGCCDLRTCFFKFHPGIKTWPGRRLCVMITKFVYI